MRRDRGGRKCFKKKEIFHSIKCDDTFKKKETQHFKVLDSEEYLKLFQNFMYKVNFPYKNKTSYIVQ
jgi:hypothetical protein